MSRVAAMPRGVSLGSPATPAPRWVRGEALLDADFAGARYYFGGRHYPNEAAWLAATAGSRSGAAITFAAAAVSGATELLADGGFASGGLDGWVEAPAHVDNGSIDVVSNQLVVTRNGNTANYRASRPVSLSTTKAYRLAATRIGTSGSLSSCALVAGSNADLGNGISGGVGGNGQHQIGFAPTSANFHIGVSPNGTMGQVGAITFDDFTLHECLPLPGFVQGGFSLELAATTPASAASEKVLAYFGDDHDLAGGGFAVRNSVRVVRDTAQNIRVVVTANAAEQANLNLGAVGNATAFRLRLALTGSRFSASLDGSVIVTDTSGTLPPLARWRLGRSWSGEGWDGGISRVTMWAKALADADLPGA